MKKETTGKIVISEIDNRITLYDIELRNVKRGEAKRTITHMNNDWGHVYVDLDENDMPLAVTLIVNKILSKT